MVKKGRRIETANGEIPLPEAMIQHIQSFMSGKEAARTTQLSKSWYSAWLTRPSLDLDYRNFDRQSSYKFRDVANKTMQRYQDSSLKIESLRLCVEEDIDRTYADKLICNAMKLGATGLQLELPHSLPLQLALRECNSNSLEEFSLDFSYLSSSSSSILPQEVLGCQNLVKLSLRGCSIDGKYVVSCSALKSLTLHNVIFSNVDILNDIITSCISMEELSLSYCNVFRLNLYELRKLRRLFLHSVYVDSMFFNDFESRFPCLKDLSIHCCPDCSEIQITSTSLQTVSLEPISGSWRAGFDVPNIRKFSYSASCLPNKLSIKAATREWEFDISVRCYQIYKSWWFLNLKKYLTKYRRLSRISLCINFISVRADGSEHEIDGFSTVPKPLVLENLRINVAPSSYCCALLVRLFGICRPKFITHYWLSRKCYGYVKGKNESLAVLWKRLMKRLITPKCGIPDQCMFGQFGLKKVNVQVYEIFGTEWRPLLLKKPLDATITPTKKRKVRFELIWG